MKLIFLPLYIPLLLSLFLIKQSDKTLLYKDKAEIDRRLEQKRSIVYYLIVYRAFRVIYYYRLGGVVAKVLSKVYKSYPQCEIHSKYIGGGCFTLNLPFSTYISAESIGHNFTFCHLTTIGNSGHGNNAKLPIIGDNVSLGANVTIIGNVRIGDNVIIGAGSVVVKDIPNNSIAVGNPAKVIKTF